MQQANDPVEIERTTRALKARMLRAAISHTDKMDTRAAIALERSGVFRRTPMPGIPDHLLAIIEKYDHPARAIAAPGPTLIYRDEKLAQFALEVEYCLLSDDSASRSAAWNYFNCLSEKAPWTITDATREDLQSSHRELLSKEQAEWQPAAMRLFDVIEDDIRCVLAGVRQAVVGRYEDGLRKYVPRLLRPTISSLEKLQLQFTRPSEQGNALAAAIDRHSEGQSTVAEKCDAFMMAVGFLPLGDVGSFAHFVASLVKRANKGSEVFNDIWQWAEGQKSALAIFHVCVAMLDNPTWVAADNEVRFGTALLKLFESVEADGVGETASTSWALREELSQYFLKYLELNAPGAMGEVLAVWAGWLSDQVLHIFDDSLDAFARFRNVAFIPQARLVDIAFRLSTPRVAPSRLSMATHWSASPWLFGLFGKFTSRNLELVMRSMPRDALTRLEELMTSTILFGDLPKLNTHEAITYLFDAALEPAVAAWAAIIGRSERVQFWEELVALYGKLEEIPYFIERLDTIADADKVNQIILSHTARRLSLGNRLPTGDLLTKLSDEKWRLRTFAEVELGALELLATAFLSSLNQRDEKWNLSLPHIFALACEEADVDAERRELLFSFVVCACISTYSVSALERVLRGNRRLTFIDAARTWEQTLADIAKSGSRWIGARGRASLAAISTSIAA